jgi:hypothetical protein
MIFDLCKNKNRFTGVDLESHPLLSDGQTDSDWSNIVAQLRTVDC